MNFFEHQDEARRSTKRLVTLFSLAVLSIVVITNLVLLSALWFFDSSIVKDQSQINERIENVWQQNDWLTFFITYFDLQVVAWVSLLVVGVIAFVILLQRSELSGGGKVIAERLGGKKISMDTQDFHERVILNVVEEMSIASGIAVPPVYVLPEKSINAFAAGFETGDAVIGISRGAIENLNRDELQGVVAHEFSHIFNGDMRLNINLIAVLAGIMFIGHTGWFFVRGSGRRSRRSNREISGGLAVVGLALVLLGTLGTFFGNLIKAAVSRQREFLADASAVQYTRNPEGIAGALKKIGGSMYGSRVVASHAQEMSHLFFSDALKHMSVGFSSFMATHPPLEERIRRIQPRWDGKFIRLKSGQKQFIDEASAAENVSSFSGVSSHEQVDVINTSVESLSNTIDSVGQINFESYQQADNFLQALDVKLQSALRETQAAKAFIYSLLLDKEFPDHRQQQINYLKQQENSAVNKYLESLSEPISQLEKRDRINLIELSIPSLKEMTREEYDAFVRHVVFLVKADKEIDLFEWLMHSLLIHYLKGHFYKVELRRPKYRNLSRLRNECKFLLSYITYTGRLGSQESYQEIFNKGFDVLELGSTSIAPQDQLQLSDLNKAMFHFSHLFPLVKPRLLKACATCIQADGHVGIEQYELLRAIASLLDCPMPLIGLEN